MATVEAGTVTAGIETLANEALAAASAVAQVLAAPHAFLYFR